MSQAGFLGSAIGFWEGGLITVRLRAILQAGRDLTSSSVEDRVTRTVGWGQNS